MLADVSNEIQKTEVFEPIGVVDDARCVVSIEVQKLLELGFLTSEVVLDSVDVEELAFGGLPTRVADHSCGSADQRNGVVPTALPVHQHHYRHQVSNVQGVGGGIESNVARDIAFCEQFFQPGRHVMQHAAPLQFADKIHGRQR